MEELEFLTGIAMQAGAIALAEQAQLTPDRIHTKATQLDLVTDADRKVEAFLSREIRNRFPDHDIYGEETGRTGDRGEYCWIIDPIDGTTSFIHQLPNWCVSIGLYRRGEALASVVYAPASRELYAAEKGKGAYCNGVRLHVSARSCLEESLVTTGFSCLRAGWQEENNLKFFDRISPKVAGVRRFGSAALDLCLVASGKAEAFWELGVENYDIAAGELMVREAGGQVTDLFGKDQYPLHGTLATNGVLQDTMLNFFQDYRCIRK